ncbi:MAG TPA: gluconate:H+ symporter [Bryobacteraceae bacterium]|jgi:gluconate transporter
MPILPLTLVAVGLLLILILVVRLHAAVALLITAMALGLAAGMNPPAVLTSIQKGFGEALGFIAVVLGLGAMIGAYIESSGGGRVLADWLLVKFGKERAVWAVLLASFLVGLPLFFEVAFIVLIPVIWSLTKESKKSLLMFGMPMATAMTVAHAMVPLHPGPAAAAQLLGADFGQVTLYSVFLCIPMIIVGGVIYGEWIARRLFVPLPPFADQPEIVKEGKPPAVGLVILLLLLPVLMIAATAIPTIRTNKAVQFFGHPFTALTVTALSAMVFLGAMRGINRKQIAKIATDSLVPIGSLLFIMGGGGGLKQIIVDTGAGDAMGRLLASSHVSLLLAAFLMSGLMRLAQGSATVAIITSAGIIAPMAKVATGYRPEMIYLAVCCGGTMISHVNDAGFWIVNQYFGMTVGQSLRTWSTMKLGVAILGICIILIVQAIIG